jgi:hypothetical protein
MATMSEVWVCRTAGLSWWVPMTMSTLPIAVVITQYEMSMTK